jgi:L-amino acid N-acyltransferase YncA
MSALLAECETRGLRQIVAVIDDSANSANSASIALYRRLGFSMVGTMRSAGYKFGRQHADAAPARCQRQHPAPRRVW